MTDLNHYDGENRYGQNGHRRCRSSFWIHDPEQVFSELNLRDGDCFLDMGCGSGDYAIRASEIVGNSGKVFALDRWQDGIDDLTEKAGSLRLNNLRAIAADITAPLPIEDGSIDVCFLATVLHIFKLADVEGVLFNEIRRVLKPGGRIVIINCKREIQPFGPPVHMRQSPEELEGCINSYGFEKTSLADLGFHYMIQFIKK